MPLVRLFVVVFVLAVGAGFVVGSVLPGDERERSAPEEPAEEPAGEPAEEPLEEPVEEEPVGEEPPALPAPPPPEPPVILLAGDSVMRGLAPAVEAALGDGAHGEVTFILTPVLAKDQSARFAWIRNLSEVDPDVVVLFLGTWEDGVIPGQPDLEISSGEWATAYREVVVEPWLEAATARGAEVVWIGAPPVPPVERMAFFEEINAVYERVAEDDPAVRYLDPTAALGEGGDGFQFSVVIDGEELPLRHEDGLHLCADGAVILTRHLLDELRQSVKFFTARGWGDGEWREDQALYDTEACAPS